MLIAITLTAALTATARDDGVDDGICVILGLLLLLALSQLAIGMLNWMATLLVQPHPLPRMDFPRGLPASVRTLVVVPTLLSNVEGVDDLVEALEVRFLANRDPHLYFGLLTDFADAAAESLPEDAYLLRHIQKAIEDLNEKYALDPAEHGATPTTLLSLSPPAPLESAGTAWMGHERKRGKLADLNALLRDRGREGFSLIVGDTDVLSGVKYVITLDTDTQLPRDAARQFVGVMAHPLNRARFGVRAQARPANGSLQATEYCSRG